MSKVSSNDPKCIDFYSIHEQNGMKLWIKNTKDFVWGFFWNDVKAALTLIENTNVAHQAFNTSTRV